MNNHYINLTSNEQLLDKYNHYINLTSNEQSLYKSNI